MSDICFILSNVCFILSDICFVLSDISFVLGYAFIQCCNILIGLMQLAAVDSVSRGFAYFACSYTADLAVCSNSHLTQLSACGGDLAVVAACIAYVQLAVTQCGITGIYAVFQYYVADFTCSCDYFAVFIYGEVVVCCVECAGAVYKERHNSVFCHSTYGQVVFGVQCIGLDGVYINVFVQLNLNFSAVMAYADVLVTAEVNIIAGFYFGCFGCNTVGSQVPACIFSCSLQLCNVYSIGSFTASCYVGDLTSNFFTLYRTAYRYSTSVGFPSKAVFIFIRSIQANNMGFSISKRGGTNCNTPTCFYFRIIT